MDADKDKVRLSVDLSPELYQLILQLSEKLDCSRSSVFRKAIALFEVCMDGKKKGLQTCVVDKDDKVVAIVVL